MVHGLAFNRFRDPDSSESFTTVATATALRISTHAETAACWWRVVTSHRSPEPRPPVHAPFMITKA